MRERNSFAQTGAGEGNRNSFVFESRRTFSKRIFEKGVEFKLKVRDS